MNPTSISLLIFGLTLLLILLERADRTIIAVAGAAAMVTAGVAMSFYGEQQAIAAIDFDTLGLLLGMMIMVTLLRPTGLFEVVAAWAARRSGGRPAILLILLGVLTALASMVLPNVTTVVLIAPLTVMISEVMGVSAIPLLVAEAIMSNVGGVGTLIGDPPNVLIASAADLTFTDFLTHTMPVVLLAIPFVLAVLLVLFRRSLRGRPAAGVLEGLRPGEAWRDRRTAVKVLITLIGALALFLFQDPLNLEAAYIALTMAALALLWVQPPMSRFLDGIEWQVLLFFASLFVLVGGLEASGALEKVANSMAALFSGNPLFTALAILWFVALASGVVDNIPITVAMIPIIQQMGILGMNITPLWWALAFGAGFGGNTTIVGSATNILVAEVSEQTPTPVTSGRWLRVGLPVMLLTCTLATLALVLGYEHFGG